MSTVVERMKWNSRRRTTRPEDLAYCMLGLFGVNMPLLYGEGRENAFQRLQHEILRLSNDESLFFLSPRSGAMLAVEPSDFADSTETSIEHERIVNRKPTVMANKGLQIQLALREVTMGDLIKSRLRTYISGETRGSRPWELRRNVNNASDLQRLSSYDLNLRVHVAPIYCWQGEHQLYVVLEQSRMEIDSYHRIDTIRLAQNSWVDMVDMKEVFVKTKWEPELYKGDLGYLCDSDMANLENHLRRHCLTNKHVWSQTKQDFSFLTFDALVLHSGVAFIVKKDKCGRETLETLKGFLESNQFPPVWRMNFLEAVRQVKEGRPVNENSAMEDLLEDILLG